MALTSEYQQQLKRNAENLIYAFIAETNLKYCGSKKSIAIITKKRAYQQRFMQIIANKSGAAATEVSAYVQQCIIERYGMDVQTVLMKLAQGKTVNGKNWRSGIYGIGDLDGQTANFGDGVTVNAKNGTIYKNGVVQIGSNVQKIYATDSDINGGKPYLAGYCWYDKKANKSYTSWAKTDCETGKVCGYYADMVSNGTNTINCSTGLEADETQKNMWSNANTCITFLSKLLEAILKLFGVETVTAKDIQISQVDDGWVEPETNKAGLWVAGGIATLGVLALGKGSKKIKNKK